MRLKSSYFTLKNYATTVFLSACSPTVKYFRLETVEVSENFLKTALTFAWDFDACVTDDSRRLELLISAIYRPLLPL